MSTQTKTETVISHTPNGRELRLVQREGQPDAFAVQPPNDNYWIERSTPADAMRDAGWPEDVVEQYTGDWQAW